MVYQTNFTATRCKGCVEPFAFLRLVSAQQPPLPVDRLKAGADDVPECARRLFGHVVREMPRVPDHHVLVVDRLPVFEAVEVRLGGRSYGNDPVVDLRPAVAQNPDIALLLSSGRHPTRKRSWRIPKGSTGRPQTGCLGLRGMFLRVERGEQEPRCPSEPKDR